MGHKKLVKFEALETFKNVLQFPKDIKGKWSEFFGNSYPITLELACGKGEYSVGLGREHKDRNFIGIDIKGNRIYTGAKTALKEGLTNVGFLRTQIARIDEYFGANEIGEIWIIFPDPFLKKESNRLTHPRFLYLYQKVMVPGGVVNLKTDSPELYESTKEFIAEAGCTVVTDIADIYGKGAATGPLAIKTFYEHMHLADGRTIYYISFRLPDTTIQLKGRFLRHAEATEGR